MQIKARDYKIVQSDIPVPTLQDDGTYVPTNCLLIKFNIHSAVIPQILQPFGFKEQFLFVIDRYKKNAVLHALTNTNITTDKFEPSEDILSLASHILYNGNDTPAEGILFETNYKYRSDRQGHYDNGAKYTHCGEPLLRAFQTLYADRDIICRAPFGVEGFYLKHNFTRVEDTESHFQWGPINTNLGTSR
ncbi:MAG: hypothetical protein J6T57_01085 [Alphaproteobacteria bacterium]|nr:hypothetical protein [Alphaproteobacteria bacterium]